MGVYVRAEDGNVGKGKDENFCELQRQVKMDFFVYPSLCIKRIPASISYNYRHHEKHLYLNMDFIALFHPQIVSGVQSNNNVNIKKIS